MKIEPLEASVIRATNNSYSNVNINSGKRQLLTDIKYVKGKMNDY